MYLLLFLASVDGFMHETSYFLLDNNLFIHQVHSYTVDVVFTLSYKRLSDAPDVLIQIAVENMYVRLGNIFMSLLCASHITNS